MKAEKCDRGEKFKMYRSLPSLREYLLLSQTRVHVEHFVKNEHGQWTLFDYEGEEAVVTLATVPCEVTLKDLYDKIVV